MSLPCETIVWRLIIRNRQSLLLAHAFFSKAAGIFLLEDTGISRNVTSSCRVVRSHHEFEGPEQPILLSSPGFSIYIVHPCRSSISIYEFDVELRVSLNKEVYAPAWPNSATTWRRVSSKSCSKRRLGDGAPLLRESDLCRVISKAHYEREDQPVPS